METLHFNEDYKLIISLLKERKLWNKRIARKLSDSKSLRHAKHISAMLIAQQNKLFELIKVAEKFKLDFQSDFSFAMVNIDIFDIKKLSKKINDQIDFLKYKEKCYERLSRISLPSYLLDAIKNSKDKVELDKALYPVPYQILLNNKLVKSLSDKGLRTISSVRAISTNMKNQ